MSGSTLTSGACLCVDCGNRFRAPVLPQLDERRHLYYSAPGGVIGYVNAADCRALNTLKHLCRSAHMECTGEALARLLLACAESSSAGGIYFPDPTPVCPRCVGRNVRWTADSDETAATQMSVRIETVRFDGFNRMPPGQRFELISQLAGVPPEQWKERVQVPLCHPRHINEIALPELTAPETTPAWSGRLEDPFNPAAFAAPVPAPDAAPELADTQDPGPPSENAFVDNPLLDLSSDVIDQWRSTPSTLTPMGLAPAPEPRRFDGLRRRLRRGLADQSVDLLSPSMTVDMKGGVDRPARKANAVPGWRVAAHVAGLGLLLLGGAAFIGYATIHFDHSRGVGALPPPAIPSAASAASPAGATAVSVPVSGDTVSVPTAVPVSPQPSTQPQAATEHASGAVAPATVLKGLVAYEAVKAVIANPPNVVQFNSVRFGAKAWTELSQAWSHTPPRLVIVSGDCNSRCLTLAALGRQRIMGRDVVLHAAALDVAQAQVLRTAGVDPLLIKALVHVPAAGSALTISRSLALESGLFSRQY